MNLLKRIIKLKDYLLQQVLRGVQKSNIIFLCVGTQPKNTNAADLTQIFNAAKEVSKNIKSSKIIINKSTVPVTTGDQIEKIISKS